MTTVVNMMTNMVTVEQKQMKNSELIQTDEEKEKLTTSDLMYLRIACIWLLKIMTVAKCQNQEMQSRNYLRNWNASIGRWLTKNDF